ncbi:MAG: DUF924 family protein [Acidobacteriota bacterium]
MKESARATVERVVGFWFGELEISKPGAAAEEHLRERWFGGGEAFDREIERHFESLLPALEASLRGSEPQVPSDLLADEPAARLARVLVLDQFSRNLYRDGAAMFATDDLALAETMKGLEEGVDAQLGGDARAFFLMPLMHSEDREVQRLSVESFGRLLEDSPESYREPAENYLDYARQHRVIVDRFGRYPHRNGLLGRASTGEEEEFLGQPGSSF